MCAKKLRSLRLKYLQSKARPDQWGMDPPCHQKQCCLYSYYDYKFVILYIMVVFSIAIKKIFFQFVYYGWFL